MTLRIHDTLSDSLQPVEAQDGKRFRFYCCGPTVYAAAHIGNFRTFVVQDVFRRVLEVGGLPTMHVRNITDVDDKTIRESIRSGKSLSEFTDFWTDKFHQDCEALNLLPPHIEPGAVAHIPEQIEMISTLIEKGFAYRSEEGSVYFRVESFPEYGRLSRVKERELTTDSVPTDADEPDRESMADFAMWKAAKADDGDNVWESPWGPGRPGWHIECSAMAVKYLGASFDLHSGGIDLVFPHHENEIAQSECSTGEVFARLWLHVVHLMVDGQKMSKRLGNLYTLDDLAERGYTAAECRYALIAGHYRKHLNFQFSTLDAARGNLQRLARLQSMLPAVEGEARAAKGTGRFQPAWEALEDNLNVPKCLGDLFRVAGELEKDPASATEADAMGLACILQATGLLLPELEAEAEAPDDIQALAEARAQARQEKNWAESDRLRDALAEAGWQVKDSKEGWTLEKL